MNFFIVFSLFIFSRLISADDYYFLNGLYYFQSSVFLKKDEVMFKLFFKIKSRLTTKARRVKEVRSKALLLTNIVGFLRVLHAVQRLRGYLWFF